MTTPADLEAAGRALYGPAWGRRLAADLPVGYRTLQRWVGGDYPPPAWVSWALLDLLDAEIAAGVARHAARAAQAQDRAPVAALVEAEVDRLAILRDLRARLSRGTDAGR